MGKRMPRLSGSALVHAFRILLTFHLIAITWVFFRASSISVAWSVLHRIGSQIVQLPSLFVHFPFTVEHYTGLILIALLMVIEMFDERRSIFHRVASAPIAIRWGIYYLFLFSLLIMGRWQTREFIYMQF
jgi:hypothetical protein